MDAVGVRTLGHSVGEVELSAEVIAAGIGATAEQVRHWNASQRIFGGTRSAPQLAADAAQICLRDANVSIEDVGAIIWCTGNDPAGGRGELHVQHLLGAKNAFAIEVGTVCSELITALWAAHALVASGSVERALVVGADHFEGTRALGLPPDIYQPIFSDVGGAALVERTDRRVLLGFGAATLGKAWNSLQSAASMRPNASTKADLPSLTEIFLESVPMNRVAMQRCLAAARLDKEQIDHLVLSREGPDIVERVARALGFKRDRLVLADGGPTHSGTADPLLGLEQLEQSGRGRPGQHVLLGSRTLGIMRFAALRL